MRRFWVQEEAAAHEGLPRFVEHSTPTRTAMNTTAKISSGFAGTGLAGLCPGAPSSTTSTYLPHRCPSLRYEAHPRPASRRRGSGMPFAPNLKVPSQLRANRCPESGCLFLEEPALHV